MLWVTIFHLVMSDQSVFKFYADESLCLDAAVNYVMLNYQVERPFCVKFKGTKAEYIAEHITPYEGTIKEML